MYELKCDSAGIGWVEGRDGKKAVTPCPKVLLKHSARCLGSVVLEMEGELAGVGIEGSDNVGGEIHHQIGPAQGYLEEKRSR